MLKAALSSNEEIHIRSLAITAANLASCELHLSCCEKGRCRGAATLIFCCGGNALYIGYLNGKYVLQFWLGTGWCGKKKKKLPVEAS